MEIEQVTKTVDVHSRIADQIVRAIELGVSDCEMPWHRRAGAGFPRNPLTGMLYRGINTVALWSASRLCGYGMPYWATYLQWKNLGAQVRQGAHGTTIAFYKPAARSSDDNDGEQKQRERSRFLLRYFVVFNAEQVDGWSQAVEQQNTTPNALDLAEMFVKALAADIRYGSDSAYYSPKFDRIYMPNRADFVDTKSGGSTEGFYAVLLHEHIHWSGHASRLQRDLSGRYGSSAYAMEELIAELGAAFLCGTLGISNDPRPDHASYIATWLKVLKEQKTAIFVAASAASVASIFLRNLFLQKYAAQ